MLLDYTLLYIKTIAYKSQNKAYSAHNAILVGRF